jgi:hypothetical protein
MELASVVVCSPTSCSIVDTPTFRAIVDTPTLSIRTRDARANASKSFERCCTLERDRCTPCFTVAVEELLEENFFKKAQRSRILRLPQPEHRLLAHFRVAIILRDLN